MSDPQDFSNSTNPASQPGGENVVCRRPSLGRPLKIIVSLTLVIFAVEAAVMVLLSFLPPLSTVQRALIDSSLLLVFLSPALYWCLFRPLTQHIQDRNEAFEVLRKNEQRLEYITHYDNLTQLPNRLLFCDRLKHVLGRARRGRNKLAVLIVDLDRFKKINDSLGHEKGDEVLSVVARRLSGSIRESDTVARLGGDEFIVLCEEFADAKNIARVARRALDALSGAIDLDGQEVFLSGSIGISLFPEDGKTFEDLMMAAEAAVSKAKTQGKNNYQFYTANMNSRASEMLQLEGALRRALEQGQFVPHFQPLVDLQSGAPIGMETLLRWQHPERGLVSPAEFIPLAEETGLIVPVGEWVLHAACKQLGQWQKLGLPPLKITVNISARQFWQANLTKVVAKILRETGIDPRLLELELTESMVMQDVEGAIGAMNELTSMGVRLAIDDFGTGYSSLSTLKRFPIHTLKIDRSFVSDVTTGASDAAIASSIITLGQNLGLNVIAEGIETDDHWNFLKEKGCRQGQGFLFSRPLPADQMEAYLVKGSNHKPAR